MTLTIDWIKQLSELNTSQNELYPDVAIDVNNNIYVTYITNGYISGNTSEGNYDVVVVKINNSGNIIWKTQNPLFNTPDREYLSYIAVDKLGYPYIIYLTDGSAVLSSGNQDIVVFKLDTNTGNLLWITQNSTPHNINSSAIEYNSSITIDDDNNIYIAYSTSGVVAPELGNVSSGGGSDIVLAKLNPMNGNVIWVTQKPTHNTGGYDYVPSISADRFGFIYMIYRTTGIIAGGTSFGSTDIVIVKFNIYGDVIWAIQDLGFNTISEDNYPIIKADYDGNIVGSFLTWGTISGNVNSGGTDIVVFKLDKDGLLLWNRQTSQYNSIQYDITPHISVDILGNIYVSFLTDGSRSGTTLSGSVDTVVTKFDKNGNFLWVKQDNTHNTTIYNYDIRTVTDVVGNLYAVSSVVGYIPNGSSSGNWDVVTMKFKTSAPISPPPEPLIRQTMCFTFETLCKISFNKYTKSVIVFKILRNNKKMYKVGDLTMTYDHPIIYKKKLITWEDYALTKNYLIVENTEHKYIYNIVGNFVQCSDLNIFKISKNMSIVGGYISPYFIYNIKIKLNILHKLTDINVDKHIICDIKNICNDIYQQGYYIAIL